MKEFYNPQAVFKLLKGKTDGAKLLSDIVPSTVYCTENISWRELLCHQSDMPAIEVLENLYAVANRMQAFRDTIFGGNTITIDSAWRSSAYNKKIGGAPQSAHVKGMALDVKVGNIAPSVVQKLLKAHSGGLGSYKQFTHVDISTDRRWSGNDE